MGKAGQGEERWEEDLERPSSLHHVGGSIRQKQLEQVLIKVGAKKQKKVILEAKKVKRLVFGKKVKK